jgi:hypothetical protein
MSRCPADAAVPGVRSFSANIDQPGRRGAEAAFSAAETFGSRGGSAPRLSEARARIGKIRCSGILMRPSRYAAIAATFILGLSGSSASAFDVTGSWAGKASCKGLGDGQKFALKVDIAANVSQSGRDVNIEFAGLSFFAGASGIAIPDAKKPDKGELGIVACGTHAEPVFGVTARAKVSTATGKTKATIKFVAIVAGKDFTGIGITDGTFTCTGTLKRTQTLDPGVGACVM